MYIICVSYSQLLFPPPILQSYNHTIATLHDSMIYNKLHHQSCSDDIIKIFRLGIKRRLLSESPDLKGLSKSDRKIELEILYDDHINRLKRILKAARRVIISSETSD